MTDLPVETYSVPARLGTTARVEGDELVVSIAPFPPLLRCGAVRASVVSYLIDCAAGIPLQAPDAWTLTTDMTVRSLAAPAPQTLTARFVPLRRGRRTAAGRVDVLDGSGRIVGHGAIGFARVTHQDGDPPLPAFTLQQIAEHFGSVPPITEPLRDAAGIEVVDAAAGEVEVALEPKLLNPAGTLQGAMTALVGEVAAEEALSTRSDTPVVITDLDIRYRARTTAGPVRTRSDILGPGPDAVVIVELVDASTGTVAAIVHARGAPAPATQEPS